MTREDLNSLPNAVLPLPALLTSDGDVEVVAGYTDEEQPDSTDLVAVIVDGPRKEAREGRCRASAVCFDARVSQPDAVETTDAIAVELEHEDGESVAIYQPYNLQGSGGVAYGELLATDLEPRVFASGE